MARSFFGINIGHFSHSYRDEMRYSKLINLRNLFQRVNNTNVKSKKHTKSCQFAPEPCQRESDPEKVRIIVESKNSSRRRLESGNRVMYLDKGGIFLTISDIGTDITYAENHD